MEQVIRITQTESPLGTLTLADDNGTLCGLWISGQKHDRSVLKDREVIEEETDLHRKVRSWLARYFAGENPDPDFEIRFSGTEFQNRVWTLMKDIPFGTVTCYRDLAETYGKRYGSRTSPRAIGSAVARNPVMIVVPCHRILAADGSLSGYAGGLDRKIRLLELEGIQIQKTAKAVRK